MNVTVTIAREDDLMVNENVEETIELDDNTVDELSYYIRKDHFTQYNENQSDSFVVAHWIKRLINSKIEDYGML